MKFGRLSTRDAVGAVAVHTLRAGGITLKKGVTITDADAAALASGGIESVVAVHLEPGDVGENEAAGRLADACRGDGTRVEPPFTGRANLFATASGLVSVDA